MEEVAAHVNVNVPVSSTSQRLLGSNPYFSAGAGLLGLGTALAVARQMIGRYGSMIQRQFIVSLEITSKDRLYPWVLQWITSVPSWRRHLVSVASFSSPRNTLSRGTNGDYQLIPGPGVHYFCHNGRWYKMERTREKISEGSAPGSASMWMTHQQMETIMLSTFGRRTSLFNDILTECAELARAAYHGRTIIYTSWANEWRPFGHPHRKRELSSVVLDQEISQRLIQDVFTFLSSSEWYSRRGIPYRRGYLLHGPPGTGKSSFVKALAGHLDYNICLLNLGEGIMTDDRLLHLLTVLPDRSILLLEDIDAIIPPSAGGSFQPRSKDASQVSSGATRVTLSGLLNALDGVASAEDRILFMTTNHYERLDPALLRPGRIDVQQYFGYATSLQAKRMFMQFYPGRSELAEEFAVLITEQAAISPAQIQGHFIIYRDGPEAALDAMKSLLADSARSGNKVS